MPRPWNRCRHIVTQAWRALVHSLSQQIADGSDGERGLDTVWANQPRRAPSCATYLATFTTHLGMLPCGSAPDMVVTRHEVSLCGRRLAEKQAQARTYDLRGWICVKEMRSVDRWKRLFGGAFWCVQDMA